MKSKGLKFLMVLAFVIAACAIAIAENGNEDSKQQEVSATVISPDTNSAVKEDSNQQEVSTIVISPDTNSAVNEDSNQQEVSTTVAIPDVNSAVNEGSKQKEVSTALEQRMQKTISVDFRNTPIEDVIRIMAEQASVDIIKSPTVTGNVTATLTNVPLVEALDNILTVHGYAYVATENMIRVAPASEITEKAERLVNRIYRITYADVDKVEKALQKFISKRGSISSNVGTSNIIVTDTESKIKAIDTFIEEIDRITPQIMVEARIYDVTATEGFDIWAEWTAGRNNPITGISNVDTFNEILGTSTTNVTTKTTNTAWQESDAGLASGTESYAYRKSNPFIGGNFDSDTAGTIRLGFLDTVNIELALNVLRTQVGAKLLANPRILVLDNETADFQITTQIP
ncbi:MAG: hypothetical protein MUP16_12295, partial [Sedimentisphaerales bacterium]|nr:hypothetical protein [Sedimentisphaerales bacterium]